MTRIESAWFDYCAARLDYLRRERMLARRTHILSTALSPLYHCACGWSGVQPDVTDTSEPHPRFGTIHVAVCPKCGERVRQCQ